MKQKRQRRRCLAMGVVWLFTYASIAGTLILPDNPSAEESAFAFAITNALASTNIADLVNLHYCEHDETWAAEWYFHQLLKHPCDEVRLERIDSPRDRRDQSGLDDAHSALPVEWLLLLRQPPLPFEADSTNTVILPASRLNGRIVITRRMTAFSPFQRQLILAAGAFASVLALWYVIRFTRARRRDPAGIRYAPLGVSVLLVCFAVFCFVVLFAMVHFIDHPLRLLMLPMLGLAVGFAIILFDERRKPSSPGSQSRPTFLDALVGVWHAWRNRQGPFASTRVIGAVLMIVLALICWLGMYLWRGTSIQLHERHTQGTVLQSGHRRGVQYVYEVNGREYSGSGVGNFDRVYPRGSPVDVKYSANHPSYSTIDDDPFLFLKQIGCGLAILLGFALLAGFKRRRTWS